MKLSMGCVLSAIFDPPPSTSPDALDLVTLTQHLRGGHQRDEATVGDRSSLHGGTQCNAVDRDHKIVGADRLWAKIATHLKSQFGR